MHSGIVKSMTVMTTVAMLAVGLAGCGGGSSASGSDKGRVYFLNHKSEVADQYHQLAKDFTKKTGIKVDICLLYTSPSPRD